MVDDHTALDKDGQQFAQKHNLDLTTAPEYQAKSSESKSTLDELKSMQGAERRSARGSPWRRDAYGEGPAPDRGNRNSTRRPFSPAPSRSSIVARWRCAISLTMARPRPQPSLGVPGIR